MNNYTRFDEFVFEPWDPFSPLHFYVNRKYVLPHSLTNIFFLLFNRTRCGPEDFNPTPYPPDDDIVYEAEETPPLPPYNGFGSHEDSSYNCKTIYPQAPVKDLKQFLRKDKWVGPHTNNVLSTPLFPY